MNTKLIPYLNFNGNAAEAMNFYHSVLGGELKTQTVKEAGVAKSPAEENRLMHASLESGAITLFASDGRPDMNIQFGDSVHLSLVGSDEELLRGYFIKLAEGGTVTMPLAKQFWGDIFGMFTDKFGTHWMVNISAQQNQS